MPDLTDHNARRPSGRLCRLDGTIWLFSFAAIILLQTVRGLHPDHWMLLDYAQRLTCLVILTLSPRFRACLPLGRPTLRDLPLALLLFAAAMAGLRWLDPALSALLGGEALFSFPSYASNLERWFDITIGLALVAYQEEAMFTATLCRLLAPRTGQAATIALTCLIFAANHWSQSWGVILSAGLIHIPFTALYLRRPSLLPLVAAHWLADALWFF